MGWVVARRNVSGRSKQNNETPRQYRPHVGILPHRLPCLSRCTTVFPARPVRLSWKRTNQGGQERGVLRVKIIPGHKGRRALKAAIDLVPYWPVISFLQVLMAGNLRNGIRESFRGRKPYRSARLLASGCRGVARNRMQELPRLQQRLTPRPRQEACNGSHCNSIHAGFRNKISGVAVVRH